VYRAQGDLKSAIEAARKAKDTELLEGLLFEAGHWKELAELYKANPGDDIERLGFLAAFQRLSGDQEGMEATLEKLRRASEPRMPTRPDYIAEAMLLNGRADEGIDILLKAQKTGEVIELLTVREEYDRAIELARKSLAAGPLADSPVIRARLGRLLHYLGQKKEAVQIFDALAAHLKANPDVAGYAELIGAEALCRLDDRALDHAAAAIAQFNIEENLGGVLARLFRQRDAGDEASWYRVLRQVNPGQSPRDHLLLIRRMVMKQMPAAELNSLAGKAAEVAMQMQPPQRDVTLRAIGQMLLDCDLYEPAEDRFGQVAAMSNSAPDYISAGNAAMKAGQYARAARWYAKAQTHPQSRAAATYLRGYALVKAGKDAEGREQQRLGALLPLADQAQRMALATVLRQAGLERQAEEQELFVTRTGEFLDWQLGTAVRNIAFRARNAGRIDASTYMERASLECLHLAVSFREVGSYLTSPCSAYKERGVALVRQGKIDEGQVTLTVDGEVWASEPFTASSDRRFRLERSKNLLPGVHRVHVSVSTPDGKTYEREWTANVVERQSTVWKAEMNRFPKELEVKPIAQ
jgi:tetratricopeptide (TPR) repeat protein